jgi:hypothetical protein
MLRSVISFGVFCCAGAAAAEPVKMTREEIQRELVGALLVIDTPLRTTIPIRISPDGMLTGKAGVLASMLGASKDRGRWWLERDQICMKWFRWFDARARCISLQREANRIHWQEASGESGTATLVEAAKPKSKPKPEPVVAHKREPARRFAVAGISSAHAAATHAVEAPAAVQAPAALQAPAPVELAAASPPPAIDQPAAAPANPHFAAAMLSTIMAGAHKPAAPSRLGVGSPDAVAAAPPQPEVQPQVKVPAPSIVDRPMRRKVKQAARVAESFRAEAASFRVVGIDGPDRLNVRSGPSEYHDAVGAIPSQGRGIHIVGECEETWCPIRLHRLEGWVNRAYLAEDVMLTR